MLQIREQTKLLREIQNGNIEYLKTTLQKYSNIHWSKICYEKTGDTILHCASRLGFKDIIHYLLTSFTSSAVDCKNNDDKTALHEAAQFSQWECCEMLLMFGANVDALKRADWTPLMLACTKINENSLRTVEVLIKYGANINYVNKDGWSALHLMCREGDVNILNILIESGLNVNLKTRNGRSGMHIAALHGNLEIVKKLIEVHVDVEEIDCCGNTPLHEAVLSKNVEICRFLISEGADVTCKNKNGFGLLHLAASETDFRMINFLIKEINVDINSVTNFGWTPLHCASRKKKIDNIDCLIKNGANRDIKDNFGRTADDYLNY